MVISNRKDYIKNLIENETIDYNNPNCINCNDCCALLTIITPEEYKFYKKYFNGKGKKIFKDCVNNWKEIAERLNVENMMCPFITKTRRCAIYSIRPKTCREFHCKNSLNKFDKVAAESKEHYTFKDLLIK